MTTMNYSGLRRILLQIEPPPSTDIVQTPTQVVKAVLSVCEEKEPTCTWPLFLVKGLLSRPMSEEMDNPGPTPSTTKNIIQSCSHYSWIWAYKIAPIF